MQEEIQGLEEKLKATRAALAAAAPRHAAAQHRNEAASERLNRANTAYIALVQQQLQPPPPPAAAAAAAAERPSPRGGPASYSSRALMHSHVAAVDGIFSPEAAVASTACHGRYVPCGSERPVASYAHQAPLTLGACKAHMRPPKGGVVQELALADAIDACKTAAAEAARVAVTETCWFVQSCYRVDGGRAAPCCGVAATPGTAAHVSFSSAFASDECRLAYFVFFLAMSLEGALLTMEEDAAQVRVAERMASGVPSLLCCLVPVLRPL